MNTIYLSQSVTIITLLLTSLAFAIVGIVYSKGKLSINSYLNADRSIWKKIFNGIFGCIMFWCLDFNWSF